MQTHAHGTAVQSLAPHPLVIPERDGPAAEAEQDSLDDKGNFQEVSPGEPEPAESAAGVCVPAWVAAAAEAGPVERVRPVQPLAPPIV